MTNLPQVPKLPYISGKTLFEDDEKAKEREVSMKLMCMWWTC